MHEAPAVLAVQLGKQTVDVQPTVGFLPGVFADVTEELPGDVPATAVVDVFLLRVVLREQVERREVGLRDVA